jgi:tRNA(Ile)-lysidine synthase
MAVVSPLSGAPIMAGIEEHRLESCLRQKWPPDSWRDSHVVLAVSSGPDSVALLRATVAVKAGCGGRGELVVAHFHHMLRGAAADADQAWLDGLCRRLGVPLVVGAADSTADIGAGGDGWEAAARTARYQFLCETAETHGARYVAVAHTADDQVETVLHRILRGTGIDGLSGIPSHRPLSASVTLVRPLLQLTRLDVLRYLAEIGQDFRTDETNTDTRWTRNRLRHELLPTLRQRFNSDVDSALLRLAGQAGEAQQVIVLLAQPLAEQCVTFEHAGPLNSCETIGHVRIWCHPLQDRPPIIIREVCRIAWQQAGWPMQAMSFEHWQHLAALVASKPGATINLPGNILAQRESEAVVLGSKV